MRHNKSVTRKLCTYSYTNASITTCYAIRICMQPLFTFAQLKQ